MATVSRWWRCNSTESTSSSVVLVVTCILTASIADVLADGCFACDHQHD